ncbi:MAG TPA: extracellular solute-binding protein [Xanthobacteraceae bacterium]|nr:extracellular solute-binding protein [Xanthobacteraceae bacterium]
MNRFIVLLLLFFFAPSAMAQNADWRKTWDDLLAAAQKEGKVVVAGPPSKEVRQSLPPAFEKRYGIKLEYIAGRSSETATKLRAERQANANSIDALIGGIQTMATILYREKMIDPVRPVLVLPEVTDGSKWKKGSLWFSDPDDKYILRLSNTVSTTFYYNTKIVQPGEIKSVKDLLEPKWMGKICLQDPTVPGSGSNQAAQLYINFGEDFVKKLYIGQKPAITRDTRQLSDWVSRGDYPIALGAEDKLAEDYGKEGLPIAPLELPDLPQLISAGFGQVALLNQAPHPNAAKVFVNWLASNEGSELFARAMSVAPTRNDIDESFLPRREIPQPGGKYFDTYDWEFTVTTKEKVRQRMKELIGH